VLFKQVKFKQDQVLQLPLQHSSKQQINRHGFTIRTLT